MQPHEYQTLFEMESSYWWFKGLHGIILDNVSTLDLPNDPKILDAGCGTGQNLSTLKACYAKSVFGFDLAQEAAPFWKKRDIDQQCVASINTIPFQDDSFDMVISIDVFECSGVNELSAYSELWRIVKSGGYLLLVVPAYQWMMSPEHHKAVGASRRYTRSRLRKLVESQSVRIIRMTHLFAGLFPLTASYRILKRLTYRESNELPRSELKPINPVLNKTFIEIMNMERRLLRTMDLPFGSSILALCRKES